MSAVAVSRAMWSCGLEYASEKPGTRLVVAVSAAAAPAKARVKSRKRIPRRKSALRALPLSRLRRSTQARRGKSDTERDETTEPGRSTAQGVTELLLTAPAPSLSLDSR